MIEKTPFRISSALKDIIGRDLITNDFVAVFELVKNSFDAYASRVDIEFAEDCITLVDNGKGMSRADIIDKWLFVAYSAKADQTEDNDSERDYRNRINVTRGFAGSKGIGRFSCDRLGRYLDLYAREGERDGNDSVHLRVDWEEFERSAKREFGQVQVGLEDRAAPPAPDQASALGPHGVMLRIKGLRNDWDDQKIEKLRSYLARLVDPFSTASDLEIRTFVSHRPSTVATGVVGNDIADVLDQKTTKIEAVIEEGKITSTLTDRGTVIYKIEEENPYDALKGARIEATIFYLNRSAKVTFKRRMGIDAVGFGNLFLFVNGFRIFPIGEPTDDTFGIARRKQQGMSRFLGLRDIMGTIRVEAEPQRFREATSRDNGLIQTEDVVELYEAVDRSIFRRLERYVTNVAWPDPLEQDRDDASGLRTNAGRARVVEVVSNLAGSKNIQLLDYDRDLVSVVEERAKEFEKTLGSLVSIAERTGDEELLRRVERSRARYEDLRQAEKEARAAVERADKARAQAERSAKAATASAAAATARAGTLERQVRLLGAAQDRDSEQLNLMLHQVVIYASELDSLVRRSLKKVGRVGSLLQNSGDDGVDLVKRELDDVADLIGRISFQSRRIQTVGKVATQASIDLDSGGLEADLIQYIEEYVDDVVQAYTLDLKIIFDSNGVALNRRFAPFDVAVLVENMVSNAKKNGATCLTISCEDGSKRDTVVISISDDGPGIDNRRVDPKRLFEKGYTGNRSGTGSGLGLYHARQVAEELGGSLVLDPARDTSEPRFLLTLPRSGT